MVRWLPLIGVIWTLPWHCTYWDGKRLEPDAGNIENAFLYSDYCDDILPLLMCSCHVKVPLYWKLISFTVVSDVSNSKWVNVFFVLFFTIFWRDQYIMETWLNCTVNVLIQDMCVNVRHCLVSFILIEFFSAKKKKLQCSYVSNQRS